jgi:hypothetical protein
MSISSTGLCGSATIVISDLWHASSSSYNDISQNRLDISQNRQDISSNLSKMTDISNNRIKDIEDDITDISNNIITAIEQDITDISKWVHCK